MNRTFTYIRMQCWAACVEVAGLVPVLRRRDHGRLARFAERAYGRYIRAYQQLWPMGRPAR